MAFDYVLRIDEPHRAWVYEGTATEDEIFDVTGGIVQFEDHPEGGRRPLSNVWFGDERSTYGPLENGNVLVIRMQDGQTTTMPANVYAALWAVFTPPA